MSDIEKKIAELSSKIESLKSKQQGISYELQSLQNQLIDLKASISGETFSMPDRYIEIPPAKIAQQPSISSEEKFSSPSSKLVRSSPKIIPKERLEDFIGTNVISKVGILITIIGIFIGAKYAIDKELISPAMRILSGYVAGAALIVIAVTLKSKYENFSAVLMGGGLAVLYFITYICYGFYQLFPQALSFLLMVAITLAAVLIALWYNQKIIAVLGQVAAYAIPFLLSNGSGNVFILFSYISIINVGLLILSFKKDWKVLYRTAFFLTWIIYASWLLFKKPELKQAAIGLDFLFINFFTFYATFLSYKVVRKELYNIAEIAVLLLNALLFFFMGTYLVDYIYPNDHVLTWFTILNAVIHFSIGFVIHRQKLADQSVYQFIMGLGILFITISIPVELNGSWVTLLWALEAAILCRIAFKNQRQLYLIITIPMILIAAISLLQDWILIYPHLNYLLEKVNFAHPFLNLNFCFSVVVCGCFAYISWLSYKSQMRSGAFVASFFNRVMPVIFILALYAALFNEIHYAWDAVIQKSNFGRDNTAGNDIYYQQLSLVIYSFLYFTLCLYLNRKFIKSKVATDLLLLAGIICVLVFLIHGLNVIGELRENYLSMQTDRLQPSMMMLFIRYICFASLAILVLNAWRSIKISATKKDTFKIFTSLFNITLLAVVCSEFVHWMHLAGYQNQYKLGLTIIWALYALVLIFAGIKNKQKYLRMSAIILFGVTLLKLFFYDIASLPTVSKTIVLVILGVILLVVSFLYNKYKQIIFGDDE